MTNGKDNDTTNVSNDGGSLDQVVSPLSTIGDDTTRVETPIRDEFREIATNYTRAVQRFQDLRNETAGHFGDATIDSAVTYIRGRPRQRTSEPIKPAVSRERQQSVEDTVIATLGVMHNPTSPFYADNKSVAAAALFTLPQAADRLNPTNVGHYVLVGLGKQNATDFLPKGATLSERIDSINYFKGDKNSNLVMTALEASQNQTWYSQVSEWSADTLQSVRNTATQYKNKFTAWLDEEPQQEKESDKRETHYMKNTVIAAGIATIFGIGAYQTSPTVRSVVSGVSLAAQTGWEYITSGNSEKKVEWDAKMYDAIAKNQGNKEAQRTALNHVIDAYVCAEQPTGMAVLGGNIDQAAKDVCRNFGDYDDCRNLVKENLTAAAGGYDRIEGFTINCPGDKK